MASPAWFATALSATAFRSPELGIDHLIAQWEKIVGTPMEEVHKRTADWDTEWVTGALDIATVMIEEQRGRVDLVFRFPMTADTDLANAFVTFEACWTNFVPLARSWFQLIEPMPRFAIGAQLIRPFENSDEMVAALNAMVPVQFAQDAADFVYQINRWSRYDGLENFCLNRIARWNVVDLELRTRDLTPTRKPTCALTLDLNTDARRSEPLPHDQIEGILSILAESAVAIAKTGDRPVIS